MITGEQAVAAAHAFERGYRAYQERGLTARNPYHSTSQQFSHERWSEGFAKAKDQLR